MKDLVERIAKALVDHPDQVSTHMVVGGKTVAVELQVAKEDLGKIIGRRGRTAAAMRAVLNAAGAKEGKRYALEILE